MEMVSTFNGINSFGGDDSLFPSLGQMAHVSGEMKAAEASQQRNQNRGFSIHFWSNWQVMVSLSFDVCVCDAKRFIAIYLHACSFLRWHQHAIMKSYISFSSLLFFPFPICVGITVNFSIECADC